MAKKPVSASYDSIIPEYGDGIPGIVREKVDGAVDALKTKVNDTAWEMSTKGIGQGLLIGVALVIGGSIFSATGDGGLAYGLDFGFRRGVYALFQQPVAWATLVASAAFGAIADVEKNQRDLAKDVALAQSTMQGLSKNLTVVQQKTEDHSKAILEFTDNQKECPGFVARENARRQAAAMAAAHSTPQQEMRV